MHITYITFTLNCLKVLLFRTLQLFRLSLTAFSYLNGLDYLALTNVIALCLIWLLQLEARAGRMMSLTSSSVTNSLTALTECTALLAPPSSDVKSYS